MCIRDRYCFASGRSAVRRLEVRQLCGVKTFSGDGRPTGFGLSGSALSEAAAAVSYTHLDVYKRQVVTDHCAQTEILKMTDLEFLAAFKITLE